MILKYMRIIAVTFVAILKNHQGKLQICEDFFQLILRDDAHSCVNCSILIDEGPRWLRRNVIFAKYQRSSVVEIVKGQRMTINEVEV